MSTILTREQIAEIAARERTATPGPWVSKDRGSMLGGGVAVPKDPRNQDDPPYGDWFGVAGWTDEITNANTAFVAGARQDIPALLAHEAALREIVRALLLEHAPRCGRCGGLATHTSEVFRNVLLCAFHAKHETSTESFPAVRDAIAAGLHEEEK